MTINNAPNSAVVETITELDSHIDGALQNDVIALLPAKASSQFSVDDLYVLQDVPATHVFTLPLSRVTEKYFSKPREIYKYNDL